MNAIKLNIMNLTWNHITLLLKLCNKSEIGGYSRAKYHTNF